MPNGTGKHVFAWLVLVNGQSTIMEFVLQSMILAELSIIIDFVQDAIEAIKLLMEHANWQSIALYNL